MTDNVTEPGAVWLGLDLGTQSVRAIAVSATGDVLGVGSQRLTSQRAGPRHAQKPEEYRRAVAAASPTAVVGVPAAAIRVLAVDGTSGTALLTDRCWSRHT